MTIHTIHSHINYDKADEKDDYDGQMMFWDLVGLKFPEICLTREENPEKTSKLVQTGDRSRAAA